MITCALSITVLTFTGTCSLPACMVTLTDRTIHSLRSDPRISRMQDKASCTGLISEAWGKFTWIHSCLGIDIDVVCVLVTGETDSKQTSESLCDNTWKRKRAGAACGQTVCVHTSPHSVWFLISHRNMRGFLESSPPFEILPACLFMSSTRVFLGLHLLFSFREFPSLFASKEFSSDSPLPICLTALQP